MTFRRVTVEECNQQRIPVLFDSNVLIDAMRDERSLQREYLVKIDRALRFTSNIVLYEVAFSREGGRARRTNRESQDQLIDWGVHFIDLQVTAPVFDRVLRVEATRLRDGGVGIADLLIACTGRCRPSEAIANFAIATRNLDDFKEFAPILVHEFLPPP